ncbi:hypothetical protein QW180_17385 [Vibrio sinaloensis]|nr:hypothetical protein [Vibrio sinaloensis]
MMVNSNYNASLTLKLYAVAALIFGTYGGRVCPMLETLTAGQILFHVSFTYVIIFLVSTFFLLRNHSLVQEKPLSAP